MNRQEEVELGEKIRQWRQENGLSVADLAGMIGVGPTTITNVEKARGGRYVHFVYVYFERRGYGPAVEVQP